MAQDEIGPITLMDFQSEVIADVGLDDREALERAAWEWVLENDLNPRHLENTLSRYSTNFSLAAGSTPLVLGDEPPGDLADEYDYEQPPEHEYSG